VVVSDTLNYASEFARSGAALSLPRTAEDFAKAIITLVDQPETMRQMGTRGKIFARQYSLEETGAKVAAAMQSILHQTPFSDDLAPRIAFERR
ncbi:MAG: hypothetical protein P4L51_04430, partial [Puia sp.]|nr:hypothetical protein [Puia sp.]